MRCQKENGEEKETYQKEGKKEVAFLKKKGGLASLLCIPPARQFCIDSTL